MALEQLRAFREGREQDDLGPVRRIESDGYPLLESSELANEHEQLGAVLATINRRDHQDSARSASAELCGGDADGRTRMYLALIERTFAFDAKLSTPGDGYPFTTFFDYGSAAKVMTALFEAGVDAAAVVAPTLEWFASYRFVYWGTGPVSCVLDHLASPAAREPLDAQLRELLIVLHGQCTDYGHSSQHGRALLEKTSALLGSGPWEVLSPIEVWTAELLRRISGTPAERDWLALFEHCKKATASRPNGKWSAAAETARGRLGTDAFRAMLLTVFPLVDRGRPHPLAGTYSENVDESARMHEQNASVLRGLVWLTSDIADADVARAVGKLALSAFRKVRGVGPRAVKVGNACVYALSAMAGLDAVGQLALLRARVKTTSAQKEIDKAFTAAAEALQLPRDQVEEMAVPTYGLEQVGGLRERFSDGQATATAELSVDGTIAKLQWFDAKGKAQKSVPAFVKKDHKDELKDLQGAVKDIALMLPAQAERIDKLFLSRKRWPLAQWRERYLDHPLVGTLARRLIWSFSSDAGDPPRAGLWVSDRMQDAVGQPIALEPGLHVELWHPIGHAMSEVLAWRQALERHGVRQPFKQAHREIYTLTDAERTTRTYSNRFAAHVLRQHQMNALATARGWRAKLRMMVDDTYPPATRELPEWGLRAEYWIEGIGDDYGTDTNESGAYLRVVTDQVRFYRSGALPNTAHAGGGGYTSTAAGPGDQDVNAPLTLEEIPALVLSEVMRDVDLFVGVASVGNDPNWQDGGPEGRYRAYWHTYAFGELSESAKTRHAVLEQLLPKLKIADRTRLEERYLIVRGDLRSYKIHLGSGNILMEPNDQYLCIVAARGGATLDDRLYLPFEGDGMLSLILSKAFMLAADKKISDPTITRQISS